MTVKQITNSELRTFKWCRRNWYLTWHRRLRLNTEKPTGAASTGTRVHHALAMQYDPAATLNPLDVVEAERQLDLDTWQHDPEAQRDIEAEAELARIMVEGYLEWLEDTGADAEFEVLAAEEKLTVPFASVTEIPQMSAAGWEAVELMGKVDVRVRRLIDGLVLFLDHKTVQSIRDATSRLHLDEQMLHYTLLLYLRWVISQDPADLPGGAVYNMLRKVKRTARSKPPFYDRHLITHTPTELQSYYIRVWGEVLEIASVTAALNGGTDHRQVAWPNPTRDCSWRCPFLPVCHMFDDGSDAEGFLSAFYTEGDPLDRYADDAETED